MVVAFRRIRDSFHGTRSRDSAVPVLARHGSTYPRAIVHTLQQTKSKFLYYILSYILYLIINEIKKKTFMQYILFCNYSDVLRCITGARRALNDEATAFIARSTKIINRIFSDVRNDLGVYIGQTIIWIKLKIYRVAVNSFLVKNAIIGGEYFIKRETARSIYFINYFMSYIYTWSRVIVCKL